MLLPHPPLPAQALAHLLPQLQELPTSCSQTLRESLLQLDPRFTLTSISYQGTVLTLSRKRQADSSIQNCLNTCSADTSCAGTAYVSDTGSCTYYSAVDTATKADTPGTDFALVQHRDGASSSGNSTTSATGSATRPGVSGSSNSTSSATSSRPAGITGAGNSTSSRPTGSASRTSSATAVPSSPSTIITINGVVFLLEINISYSGITIDFAILAKRAGESLDACLTACAANSNCAGTAYDESTGTCTFYTAIDSSSRTPTNNVDFATVLSRAGATGTGAGNNGTSGAGNTTSPATNATAESFICPALDGSVLLSNLEVTFTVSCGQFLIGTTYDALAEINTKRQAVDNGLPSTLSNCVDLCSLAESCVGTTFEDATQTCTFYSAVSYATPLDGYDSATKVAGQGNDGGEVITTTTVIGGVVSTTTLTVAGTTTTQYVAAPSTATVFVTSVSTVTSYVGGATGLPSGATVTEIVPVSTITYNPTVQTITLPQNYAQPTVTVTVGGGNAAPVATQTVYQTVDQNGNVIGSSTAGAVAGGAAGNMPSYPTVTVFSSYCPTATAGSVVWTTVYV